MTAPLAPRDLPDDLLTEAQACAKVKVFDGCKHPVKQFQKWARRKGIPVRYVGRRRLYDPRILAAFLARDPWTRKHQPVAAAGESKPELRLLKARAR